MRELGRLPTIAIIGKKNSGKTTLLVAVAAELKRRGLRVASLKHGHHDFEIDHPGRATWRHFHEGGVEAVVMASSDRIALVMRTDDAERDPLGLLRRLYGGRGYDVVLVEGLKRGPFPKVEIWRSSVHDAPVYDPAAEAPAAPHLAIVTDRPEAVLAPLRAIAVDPEGGHVAAVADLVEARARADMA